VDKQRGITHIILLLLIAVLAVVVVAYFFKGKLPLPQVPGISQTQEPKVVVKTDYKNPFDKKSQYVNPFDQYKSPFLTLQNQ